MTWEECVSKNSDKDDPEAYCGYIKHKVEDKKDFNHASIIAQYKKLKEKYPDENPRILLKDIFSQEKLIQSDFTEDFTLDFVLEDIAQFFEKVQEDFLTFDEYAQPKMPGSKYQKEEVEDEYTRLQQRQKQLQEYEKAYKSEVGKQIRAIDPRIFTPTLGAITVPFEITNTETGAVVQGAVMESFEKNIKQLTPVSSSNVRGVGQFGTELLVQFHPSPGIPMRTYRYQFGSPIEAEQAYRALTGTGSPGRWIWQNIRGHTKGEPVTKAKLGPSLSPPGQGKPTIGGTSKSLVDYSISNRVPISRVTNFDEMIRQLKRKTFNPIRDPQTGQRVEKLLGTRKEIRALGLSPTAIGRQLSQLPDPYKKLDFTVLNIGNINEDYLVEGHWKHSKLGQKFWVDEHQRGEGIKSPTLEWTKEEIRNWEEWEKSIEERGKLAKEGENINPSFPMTEHQKKAYLQYIDTKFQTKRNTEILSTCSDKLIVSRTIGELRALPLSQMNTIFHIDDSFKDLPQSIQDSITEVRIHPNAVDDHLYGDKKDSNIAGFWVPWRKSVTIGMYSSYMYEGSDYNYVELPSWLNEVMVHEGAHALDDTKLTQKEIKQKEKLYKKYKGKLTRHYAGKNKDEFFAEAFTYNYLIRKDKPMKSGHHEKLMETETDINFFINSIIDKYDFMRKILWEKVEILEV